MARGSTRIRKTLVAFVGATLCNMNVTRVSRQVTLAAVMSGPSSALTAGATAPQKAALESLVHFFDNASTPLVTLGTGTSVAMNEGYGMPALQRALLEKLPSENPDVTAFRLALESKVGLEQAMDFLSSEGRRTEVRAITAEKLRQLDAVYLNAPSKCVESWPPLRLLKRIVGSLTGGSKALHVATTNYDLLAEIAFEAASIKYTTGFVGGVSRRLDWRRAINGLCHRERQVKRAKKRKKVFAAEPHVCLYKVHGSLNLFEQSGEFVENNAWMVQPPDGFKPAIVVPGVGKHQDTLNDRHTLLSQFDAAVANHQRFLFIGFGWNDSHLTGAVENRLGPNKDAEVLFLTRDPNDRITRLLSKYPRVALVCSDADKTGAYFHRAATAEPVHFPNLPLWQADVFAHHVFGV